MIKDPILLFTSTAFIAPMTYAAYYQFWHIYGTMLSMLVMGVAFHGTKNTVIMRIDQACIFHMLLFSIKTGYELNLNYLAIFMISWASYVYGYGYIINSLAFHPSYVIGSLYHASMHIFASAAWTYGIYVKHLQESEPRVL
jgi:hypothetical protein